MLHLTDTIGSIVGTDDSEELVNTTRQNIRCESSRSGAGASGSDEGFGVLEAGEVLNLGVSEQ
jgi:hypothetical protein